MSSRDQALADIRAALRALPVDRRLIVVVERRGEEDYRYKLGERFIEGDVVRAMTERPRRKREGSW
jgi:hypothetical protein